MTQCFEGINVHGLPMLSIPDGESVDYPYLSGRFKDGLTAISNTIVQRLNTPRKVTVAGNSMILNATNAEVIIGTVIAEANNGVIDLNGVNAFWSFVQQKVNSTLGATEAELKPVAPACGGQKKNPNGLTCSNCVCEYRNNVINDAITQVEALLENAKNEAMNLYNTDLTPYIEKFMERSVNVWKESQSCVNARQLRRKLRTEEQVCDLSDLNMRTPGQAINLNCNLLFTCGSVMVDTSDLKIVTNSIYVGGSTTIKNVVPPKAAKGADGAVNGESGKDGSDGLSAFSMSMAANKLLKSSGKQVIVQHTSI